MVSKIAETETYTDVEQDSVDSRISVSHRKLLSPFLLDKRVPHIPIDAERKELPYGTTNIFSEAFFSWCDPILKVGYRRILVPEDIFKISPGSRYDVGEMAARFEVALQRRIDKSQQQTTESARPSKSEKVGSNPVYSRFIVALALLDVFKKQILFCVLIRACGDVSSGMNALQVRKIVEMVSKSSDTSPHPSGYGYAVGIACLVLFQGLAYSHYMIAAQYCGAQMRSVLSHAILQKSMHINREGKILYPSSKITSFLSNDISKVELSIWYFGFILSLPTGLTITIILLVVNLGAASLAGIAYFLLITLVSSILIRHFMKLRVASNKGTDQRIKCLKDVLSSMKIIKYYSWELPYLKLLTNYRAMEMANILRLQVIRNLITATIVTLPNVSSMVSFLVVFAANNGKLSSASNVFSSVSLFNIMIGYVSQFPTALNTLSDAHIAIGRLQTFLLHPNEVADPLRLIIEKESSEMALSIKQGWFSWMPSGEISSSTTATGLVTLEKDDCSSQNSTQVSEMVDSFQGLKNVNLSIFHGELIIVTGPIGSGKSSLLAAMSGLMPHIDGSVSIAGSVTYCGASWMQNASVKENIIFGEDLNLEKYQQVVEACSLVTDFAVLPAGDKTEIGERGVNLSGGQKARINLARAVYHVYGKQERNIILLDDILSAVDAKVGEHIMTQCVSGILQDKTRILATHQLSLIDLADRLIFINSNGSIDLATKEELIKTNQEFASLMEYQSSKSSQSDDVQLSKMDVSSNLKRTFSLNTKSAELNNVENESKFHLSSEDGKLISEETRNINSIPISTIIQYLREGCGRWGMVVIIPCFLISIILTTVCMLLQNVWLNYWASNHFEGRSGSFYIGIYVLVTVLYMTCAGWQFSTVAYICNNSSKNLNIKAMRRLMHATMSFFDTTPMGRILNRFSKDTETLDNAIVEQARLFCFGISNMCGILVISCVYLPWFAIAVPFVLFIAHCFYSYYQASGQELNRIEATQRSLTYSCFEEVLSGLDIIKHHNVATKFTQRFLGYINLQNEAYFSLLGAQRWLVVRLVVCSALFNFIIEALCVSKVVAINDGDTGLLVSYMVSFSTQLISTSRSMGQLEQFLSSVERMVEYANKLPQEASYYSKPESKPSESWPRRGEIEFKNVSMSYRPGLPLALRNLNVHIRAGEKVGICGRTGSGKSTIMTALYRLCEPGDGEIMIDGVDTLSIGLYDLRSKLSIIPQESVLFRGTLRQNLDPFGDLDDDSLYGYLIEAGCINPSRLSGIRQQDPNSGEQLHPFHLDVAVDEGGSNYSLGERQVLSLCRALIRKSKILILDEATSSVDYETDARIQNTVRLKFADCTVLTIAHRLKTILDYDKILVMDKGRCLEFDTPWNLFQSEGSSFRAMCLISGIQETDFAK
ncbi:hypothetical protein OGAPHI_005407 [Ogataea philodendri]|uniref:P-loop containing nucleoside triphosphate hydrolase protein n=1 Tax=Ogataea philodendri TaxID=1378263 RepID=A0A9P8P004_9ASCO|nr:uncharacterized protein OGAPHI_005407 [Ogataea philodendri]KAH3662159.1 hypothetical protein OGAPHI_005407 [Ogataea philodendri]